MDGRLEAKLGFDKVRAAIQGRCSTDYAATRVSEEEFAERRKTWKPRINEVDGYLARYRELVTGAPQGAVLSAEGLKK